MGLFKETLQGGGRVCSCTTVMGKSLATNWFASIFFNPLYGD